MTLTERITQEDITRHGWAPLSRLPASTRPDTASSGLIGLPPPIHRGYVAMLPTTGLIRFWLPLAVNDDGARALLLSGVASARYDTTHTIVRQAVADQRHGVVINPHGLLSWIDDYTVLVVDADVFRYFTRVNIRYACNKVQLHNVPGRISRSLGFSAGDSAHWYIQILRPSMDSRP